MQAHMWLRTKSEHSHGRATTGGRMGAAAEERGAAAGEEAAQGVHDGRADGRALQSTCCHGRQATGGDSGSATGGAKGPRRRWRIPPPADESTAAATGRSRQRQRRAADGELRRRRR